MEAGEVFKSSVCLFQTQHRALTAVHLQAAQPGDTGRMVCVRVLKMACSLSALVADLT